MNDTIPAIYRLEEVPGAPDGLSDDVVAVWDTLAPLVVELGTCRGVDLPALQLLAELLADIQRMEAVIESDGYTTPSAGGSSKASPLLNSLAAARRHAQSLLDRFGLLPGSKARRAERINERNHAIYLSR